MNPMNERNARYAAAQFKAIADDAPANACAVEEREGLTVIDMGLDSPGGWSSVKRMLDALIAGRGIVNISRDFRGIHQFPAVEILYDDPVEAAGFFFENRLIGVKDGSAYAFGVAEDETCLDDARGRIALVGNTSLACAALDAARALPEAVRLLLEAGIPKENIQWAWSFSPIADLSLDPAVMRANMEKARTRRAVSVWLRGEDDDHLRAIAAAYAPGTLRLHNLTTARTIMAAAPEKVINANH